MVRFVLHLILVVCFAAPQVQVFAQDVRFPQEPATAALAQSTFRERADAIIPYVACGRELKYYQVRKLLRDGISPDEEDILTILAAKLYWVINHREDPGCVSSVVVPEAGRGDMDTLITELDKESGALPRGSHDPHLPTPCATISRPTDTIGGAKYVITVSTPCLIAQINEGIRAITKDAVAGSSDLPCLGSSEFPFVIRTIEGEWDVALRGLTRLLWMDYGHGVLEPDTLNHMWNHQLSVYGGPFESGDYPVLQLCGDERVGEILGTPEERLDREYWYREVLSSLWDIFRWLLEYTGKMAAVYALSTTGIGALPFAFAIGPAGDVAPALSFRIEETENHLLQIESSKYLINQMVLTVEPNHDNRHELQEQQNELRDWLLKRFKSIADKDFDEYNSRPYTRYSLNSVQNLLAYARDPDIKAAARILLTLSAAKFAAGSSDGRRIVPYRRLSSADIVSDLYTTHSGSDHELVRAFVYAGQTRLRGDIIDGGEAAHMIYAAIDGYPDGGFRWPIQVLETAIATSYRPPFAQHIGHDGIESYYATPAYTMILGGIQTPPIQTFLGFTHKPDDTGAAVPSMIMPTVNGRVPADVFRILGTGSAHHRSMNLCGYHGFICGINPRIPTTKYEKCLTPFDHGMTFISSIDCFPDADRKKQFYAVAMEGTCDEFCDKEHRWGLIEVTWAPDAIVTKEGGTPVRTDPDFEAFKASRHMVMLSALPDDTGRGRYVTTEGHEVNYLLDQNGSYSTEADGSSSIPGVTFYTPENTHGVFALPGIRTGDILFQEDTVEGPLIHIGSPYSSTRDIIIDFRDWHHPSITP